MGLQTVGVQSRAGLCGHVGYQPGVAAVVLLGQDGVDRHAREAGDGLLDLTQLDPEATHLDLVVVAAAVLQLAVRHPSAEVASAVHAHPSVGAEGVVHKALGGQLGPM